jgi:hypothetical protein
MISVLFIVSSLEWFVNARSPFADAARNAFGAASPGKVARAGYTHVKGGGMSVLGSWHIVDITTVATKRIAGIESSSRLRSPARLRTMLFMIREKSSDVSAKDA